MYITVQKSTTAVLVQILLYLFYELCITESVQNNILAFQISLSLFTRFSVFENGFICHITDQISDFTDNEVFWVFFCNNKK